MRAFVFINRDVVPLGAGHIGWGFETSPGRFCYGAKEMHGVGGITGVPPGGENHVFVARGTERQMLAAMRGGHPGGAGWPYHACKVLEVPDPDPEAAAALAEASKGWGYRLKGNNCMDDACRILTAYARGRPLLPDPAEPANWIPARWFARIPGEPLPLKPR